MKVGDSVPVQWAISTGGDGYWTRVVGVTQVIALELAYLDESRPGKLFGELRACFNRGSWDTWRFGLVYTDGLWIEAFRLLLESLGFSREAAQAVDYSEAGMQGDDFVSLDAKHAFLEEWDRVKDEAAV